jgi:dihydrofolate reductase
MKVSVYIATSLDGFIARDDGGLDWLPGAAPETSGCTEASGSTEGEDYGYREFMESVDILVMGRKTFEKVLSFGKWSYEDKRVIVLSSGPVEIPNGLASTVECRSSSPSDLVDDLAESGVTHIYLDGGNTIQRFLNEGLVQEVIITRIPVLIGSGIPLFGPLADDILLRHVETRQFPSGFVQSRYEVRQ